MTVLSNMQPAADSVLAGGGEMGQLMRMFDWSKTPVGPVENWPQSLRTTVSIVLASGYPMLVVWGDKYVQFYNDAFRPVLGVTKHPAGLGQSSYDCFPEIWDVIGPMFEGIRSGGNAIWAEDSLFSLDRYGFLEETYFTFSYSAIRDETGGVAGIFVTCVETTQRVLSERRLQTLRDLASATSQAQGINDAYRAAIDTLALNPSDLPFTLLYLLTENGKQAMLVGSTVLAQDSSAYIGTIELSGELIEDHWPIHSVVQTGRAMLIHDLSTRFVDIHTPVWPESVQSALLLPVARLGQKQPYGVLVTGLSPRLPLNESYEGFLKLVAGQVATAISSARAYEEERQRAEALMELDRAKTNFFSNVSHELRTPLTLLLAPVEDALVKLDTGLVGEPLEMVYRNALRLLKLVNSLLDFSRLQSNRMEAIQEPTDLSALTAELASAFRSAIEKANLELVVDCPKLPELIYVDRQMWEKVVLNLISNAFKFTFEGSITVRLSRKDDFAQLQVVDTGTGIPAEELPRVFERFHRVRNARSRTYEGTGIGLALVQELVQLQGGSIEVASELGKGSTFTVKIPLVSAHLPQDGNSAFQMQTSTIAVAATYIEEALLWLPQERNLLESVTALDQPIGDNTANLPEARLAHILVVDDSADMRGYLQRILLAQHWIVDAAANGAIALEMIGERLPDLVLSDVMMPQLDGFGLLRALRSDPRTRSVPVILVSARAGGETSVEGLEAGADDYLIKPFAAQELIARVRTNLDRAQLYEKEQRARIEAEQAKQRLAFLAEMSALLITPLDYETTFKRLSRFIIPTFADNYLVTMFDSAGRLQSVELSASLSEAEAALREIVQNYGIDPKGVGIQRAAQTGQTNFMYNVSEADIDDHAQDAHHAVLIREVGTRSYINTPLIIRDQIIGVISFGMAQSGRHYGKEDVIIAQELSHRIAQARDNAQLYSQAREAIQLRDEFLSVAAHELKTPVTSLRGFSQLLLRRLDKRGALDPEEVERVLGIIEQQSTKLSALLSQLLDISRLEAGRLKLEPATIELIGLVDGIIATLQRSTGRQITLTAPASLSTLVDPLRLEQVVVNLIDNAIKFSPQNKPVEVEISLPTPQIIRVTVTDYGIGVPPERREHIFNRFYQAHGEGFKGGMGLGLYISREIIELHKGKIWVESSDEGGTRFVFTLPIKI